MAERDPGSRRGNALRTPFLELLSLTGQSLLRASGEAVGLPRDQPGNSQAGHVTLGAGRVITQDLLRVDEAIRCGRLDDGAVGEAFRRAGQAGRNVHLVGMVSAGGVHSHIRHAVALLDMARRYRVSARMFLHAITDGRDVAARSAETDLPYLESLGARIATVSGRVFAMDRSGRSEWTAAVLAAMTGRAQARARSAVEAVRDAYRDGRTDQDVEPTAVAGEPVRPGDEVVFFNFRPDGLRQLTSAALAVGHRCTTLTRYLAGTDPAVALEAPVVTDPLGTVVAAHGLRQVRVAEQEKFGHVTYFFDGYRDTGTTEYEPVRLPSRTDVRTYAECPEMSAEAVTGATVLALERGADFVVTNFANADTVGHTGDLSAVAVAARTVDGCLRRLAEAAHAQDVTLLVTADHGNAEHMLEDDGKTPDTRHTRNRVPCWVSGPRRLVRHTGTLADIAPTCLDLLGLPAPADMTGTSLLHH